MNYSWSVVMWASQNTVNATRRVKPDWYAMSSKQVFVTSSYINLTHHLKMRKEYSIYKNIIVNRLPLKTTGYIKKKTNKTADTWIHITLNVFHHNMEITRINDDISKFFFISSTMITYVRFTCSANFWKYQRYFCEWFCNFCRYWWEVLLVGSGHWLLSSFWQSSW